MRDRPLSDVRPRSGPPTGCLVVFFAVFLAAGLFVGKLVVFDPARDLLRARSWVAAPCLVLSSEVKRHPGSDGDTFSVAIRYSYVFRGATFESGRYDFGTGSSSDVAASSAIVNRHPPGFRASCWVNPGDPSEAVLDRGLGSWAWPALIPIPFVAVGAGGIWGVVYFRRKERAERRTREAAARVGPSEPGAAPGSATRGPLVLKPKEGPRARAAGLGCVALFWNGIVGVFAAFAVKGWIAGEVPWYLSLFLAPFVLVGLGLVWAFLKAVRGLFAPRPVLTLEPARVRLGGASRLSWSFEGRPPTLSVLQLTLEGAEEAVYSRGTDRITDRALFHRSDVVVTLDPAEALAGSATLSPPPGLVPSFGAPSNRVVWTLRLTAQVQGAADVKEEYVIAVDAPETGDPGPGR